LRNKRLMKCLLSRNKGIRQLLKDRVWTVRAHNDQARVKSKSGGKWIVLKL